jgi:hypothetical protein
MFIELNNQKNYNPSLPNSYINCQYYNESHIDPKLLHPIPPPIFFNSLDTDSTLSLGNTTSTDATTTTSTTSTNTTTSTDISTSISPYIPLIVVGVLVLGLFAIKK